MKQVTIRDIAREAGVSASTVSRALSAHDRISSQTTSRILTIAQRMGYTTQDVCLEISSDSIRTQSLTVGVIVPDITVQQYATIVQGIEHECFRHNTTLLLNESRDSPAWENMALNRITDRVDGIIIIAPKLPSSQLREISSKVPLIATNRHIKGVSNIIVDIQSGINEAIKLLAMRRYRHLEYVGGPQSLWASNERYRKLKTACNEYNMTISHTSCGGLTFEHGSAYARQFISQTDNQPAQALITYNNSIALGLMAQLRHYDMHCPSDYVIIGFGDDENALVSTPALSTITTSTPEIGSQAARMLLANIDANRKTDQQPTQYATVSSRLLVRDSLGKTGTKEI